MIHLPGIFFGIQIQFFPVSCTNNPVSLLRCHDGCRSFPSLYRKKRQSFTALFMMVICLVLWVLANYIFAVISHLRASFPAVLLLSVRLMAGHIKETFILLFTMAGACLIVFLVPGLFVLFPGILCGIASHLIEPGLKKALAID